MTNVLLAQEPASYAMAHELLQEDHNVFFSPYSTEIVLSMAMTGAQGTTKDEFIRLLQKPILPQTKTTSFSSYQAIAIDHAFVPKSAFIANLQKNFQANLFSVDFQKQKEWSLQTINTWIEKKTDGLIPKLLESQDIQDQTRLILLNAALFKKAWLNRFRPDLTKQAPFTCCDGSKTSIPYMYAKEFFSYGRNELASFIELPFQKDEDDSHYSCIIIVPHDVNARVTLEKKLSSDMLNTMRQEMKNEFVELYLPKCTIDYRKDLRNVLENLGLKTAFTKAADFSGISSQEELSLDKVIHQAKLELDENGLTAAAATAAEFIAKAIFEPKQPIVLRCDRPFLLFIVDSNNTPLFIGKVCKPSGL
jgi:serpin B